MKITRTSFTFEGTPEELKLAHPLLYADLQGTTETAPAPLPSLPEEDGAKTAEILSSQAVDAFFKKTPGLSADQRAVMKHVHAAGDAGITSSELAKHIGSADVVRVAMRLFGKRAAHTRGWPKGVTTFIRKWEGKENRYLLRREFRSILENGQVTL
ncbi:hypothetical protein [Caballeronia sp. AZ10_KS36]|uniref:hypothetical protein n=1 Tax=Caballeronia sp. AZ10_KS36 TaxID=2921757 RepID=UPI0020293161|nr:hypothetical protein [Caballeronia sp. AZ10_KS36]